MEQRNRHSKKNIKWNGFLSEWDPRIGKVVVKPREATFKCPNCGAMSHYEDFCTTCYVDMGLEAVQVRKPVPEKGIQGIWHVKRDDDGNPIKRKPKSAPKSKDKKKEE